MDFDLQTFVDGSKANRVAPINCLTFNGSNTPLAANGTFTGLSRDSGASDGGISCFSYFNGFFFANQVGTAFIEGSWDNITWFVITSAALAVNTALNLRVPITFKYHRTGLLNGATLQTSLQINSSYTVS